jgi:holo-[acyl-carrier protein] synthase
MLTTGVDIIEIPRISAANERWGSRFLNRIFTPGEQAFSHGRAPQLAGRFAAKEATMKALGTGVRGVGWREIEVVRERGRAPTIRLHGRAAERARRLGITTFALSISHSRDYAVAFVVAQSGGTAP